MRRMLNAHPEVAIAPETSLVRSFWRHRHLYGDLSDDAHLDRLLEDITGRPAFQQMAIAPEAYREAVYASDRTYRSLFRVLLRLYAARHQCTVVGEKTPDHVLHIPRLRAFFPRARFVHVIRDARAVVNSWRGVHWSRGAFWADAEQWVDRVAAARRARSQLETALHTVRFEQLVRTPRPVVHQLCRQLGLNYDDRMLRYHEHPESDLNVAQEPWKKKATQPVDPAVADRWRTEMGGRAVAEVEAVAASEMQAWGYALWSTPAQRWRLRPQIWAERAVYTVRWAWTRLQDRWAGRKGQPVLASSALTRRRSDSA